MISATIAIPAYNTESTVARAIGSALGQTRQDIEILAVDDGSQDNTRAVVERAAADRRVVLINHAENKGVSAARKTLVEAARGEFIFWLDADDWILRADAIELLLPAAADADLVFFGERNQKTGGRVWLPPCSLHRMILCAIRRRGASLRPLTRRSVLKRCVFPAQNFGEDAMLVAQCLVYARKIAFSPHFLYHYTNNPSSICNNPRNVAGNTEDIMAVLDWIAAFLTERGLPDLAKAAEEEKAAALRFKRQIRRRRM